MHGIFGFAFQKKKLLTYLLKILTNAIDPEEQFESQKIEGKDSADNIGNLFSFFMLFPRDHAIPTRRLVTLCIAKGLEARPRPKALTTKNIYPLHKRPPSHCKRPKIL